MPLVNEELGNGHKYELSYLARVIGLIKERATFVNDFWDLGDYFFRAPSDYDPKAVKKGWKEETPELMKELVEILNSTDEFTSPRVEDRVKEWITSGEIGFGKVMQPFRLSVVGALKGPHLFDICELIGRQETVDRIETAIRKLS